MDAIGEIQGGRTCRQFLYLPLGGIYQNSIAEDVTLKAFHKLSATEVLIPIKELAQQIDLILKRGYPPHPFLIAPVGGNTILSHSIHLTGANLYLHRGCPPAHHRGMQGLICPLLGGSDVIIEPIGEGMPQAMDYPENTIAVLNLIHQDAKAEKVIDLAKLLALGGVFLHLPLYAIDMLWSSRNFRLYPCLLQLLLQYFGNLSDILFSLLPSRSNEANDFPIFLRLQIAEGQVLKLPLQLPYPQAVGYRGIYFDGILSNDAPLRRGQHLQRSQVV